MFCIQIPVKIDRRDFADDAVIQHFLNLCSMEGEF